MPGLRENIRDVLSRESKIDAEFSTLIPPLTPEEFSGLEQSILAEGCRDATILWDNIIIDGHNRYKICKEHNIPLRKLKLKILRAAKTLSYGYSVTSFLAVTYSFKYRLSFATLLQQHN